MPIIGNSALANSSSIERLATLSGLYILSVPPGFWANAVAAIASAGRKAVIAQRPRMFGFMSLPSPAAAPFPGL